jgi:hypothetical protein
MKSKRKVKVFFTMNPDLYVEFEKILEDKLLDKSKLIEHLIDEFIKKDKEDGR